MYVNVCIRIADIYMYRCRLDTTDRTLFFYDPG